MGRVRAFNKNGVFYLIHPHDNEKIGFFNLHLPKKGVYAETAIALGDRSWWGRGVTLELREAVTNYVFNETDLEKVIGRPSERNIASIFTYKKLGFEHVDTKQSKHPRRESTLIFEMKKDKWNGRRNKISC